MPPRSRGVHRRGVLEYVGLGGLCAGGARGGPHPGHQRELPVGRGGAVLHRPDGAAGLRLTIVLTILTMFFGAVLGLVIAVLRVSTLRPVMLLASAYITFFRGTPVLVQLIFWFNIAALYPNIAHRDPVHRRLPGHRRQPVDECDDGGDRRPVAQRGGLPGRDHSAVVSPRWTRARSRRPTRWA